MRWRAGDDEGVEAIRHTVSRGSYQPHGQLDPQSAPQIAQYALGDMSLDRCHRAFARGEAAGGIVAAPKERALGVFRVALDQRPFVTGGARDAG